MTRSGADSGAASCIFCKIIQGAIPSPRVAEDDRFICIRDIQPQAKQHLLVIPKEHIASLATAFPQSGSGRPELMGAMLEFGTRVAWSEGLLPDGFRAVLNTHAAGGQTVYHIHLHLLGGERLDGHFA